jgi:hypothetical protein
MMPFIIFGLFFLLIGGLVYAVISYNNKRRSELQLVAQQLKLRFSPKGDDSIAPLLSNLEFFAKGMNCQVTNLIQGNISRHGKSPVTVAIFDYQFALGLGRRTEVSYDEEGASVSSSEDLTYFFQTVMVFYDESVNSPWYNLRPEDLFDKVGNIVGFEDINFRDFPVFSKQYRLQSGNVEEVRDLFQSNLIKFYETNKICTEANGSYVVIYPFPINKHQSYRHGNSTRSTVLSPNEIGPFLSKGLKLLNLLELNTAELARR